MIASLNERSRAFRRNAFSRHSEFLQMYAPRPFFRPLGSIEKLPSGSCTIRISSFFSFFSPQPMQVLSGVEDRGAEGLVQIVGGSISDTIIDGIERGGIAFTITPNPEDTGRKAFRELERYFRHGVANYASTVELQVISAENVEAYRQDAASVDAVKTAPGIGIAAVEEDSDLRASAGAEAPALAEGAEEKSDARAVDDVEVPALAEAAEVVS